MRKDMRTLAEECGCGEQFNTWMVLPNAFGASLIGATKRYARFLTDAGLVSSHSAALEVVARAAGLLNWHTLHTLAQGLVEDFNPTAPEPSPFSEEARMRPMSSALPFLTSTREACPPTEKEKEGLTLVAAKLSAQLNCPAEKVLGLIAKMNGADTWAKLLMRKPQDSKAVLYTFQTDNSPGSLGGKFKWSQVRIALVEQQDELYQGYGLWPEVQVKFKKLLREVLKKRPDFLEGHLAQAEVFQDKAATYLLAGPIYAQAIAQAEALIPASHKGEIPWGYTENRFYHRLLYGYMTWNARWGSIPKAIALARKQLRLNKADNLGLRIWLPVLLCAAGKVEVADKVLPKMAPPDVSDGNLAMVRAIVHFMNGRVQQALESMLIGLFEYPALRHILSRDDFAFIESVGAGHRDTRICIPDAEMMVRQYVAVARSQNPMLVVFFRLTRRADVKAEEARLAAVYRAATGAGGEGLARWEADLRATAARLAAKTMA